MCHYQQCHSIDLITVELGLGVVVEPDQAVRVAGDGRHHLCHDHHHCSLAQSLSN